MPNAKHRYSGLLLFLFLLFAAPLFQGTAAGSRPAEILLLHSPTNTKLHFKGDKEGWVKKKSRRMLIGSVAPSCTYNECKGCKNKCRAKQVPVEGNDPINSPYHYKCVCQ